MTDELGSGIVGGGEIGNEDGSLISRFEIARNDIMAEFATISTANGYRNDVADVINAIRAPFKITEFVEIGVVIGERRINMEASDWQLGKGLCSVFVQGVCEANSEMEKANQVLNNKIESLAHDMVRVLHTLTVKYLVNFPRGRWHIVATEPMRINVGIDFGDKSNKGVVRAEFTIQLDTLDENYD